jgi:hypothetical protein
MCCWVNFFLFFVREREATKTPNKTQQCHHTLKDQFFEFLRSLSTHEKGVNIYVFVLVGAVRNLPEPSRCCASELHKHQG